MSTNPDVAVAPPPTRAPQVAADAHGAGAAARSWLGAALLGVAAGVAALSLLGPLVSDVIDYRITDPILSQLIGLDAVSLALVAPLAALAGVLTLRGHTLGPVLALGPAAYVAYMVPQYVLGPDYLNQTGNNEQFFGLLDLGLALPACAAVCIGVRHAARWAQKGLYAIVAWYAFVGTAVAAMAISMYVRDDSTMSAAQMAIMSMLGAALVTLFILLHAPLLRRAQARGSDANPSRGAP